jgi:hypothetical protein
VTPETTPALETPEATTPPRWVRLLRGPFDASADALEPILTGERPILNGGLVAVSLVAAWYLYVPVHELLHALGCVATGGTVETLEIQTQYGGGLLARVFPFVHAGGEYAGRLSGFDTHGSDWVYLATDALPFTLSVLIGVPMLRAGARRARPLLLGPGFVLGLAPFYNLPGDYFEMASIVVTAVIGEKWHGLRSDDLFLLIDRLFADPASLGLTEASTPWALAAIATASLLAVALAYATWALGDLASRIKRPGRR